MPVSDDELAAAIAALNPEQRSQLESALGGSVRETPALETAPSDLEFERRSQLPTITKPGLVSARDPSARLPTAEETLELAPTFGAVTGGLAGPPGAVLGGIIGESGRQLGRRVLGVPQATGVTQRALGLDPESPAAAAASIGGETVAGLGGNVASKLLGAIGRGLSRSSLRSLLNILQPRTQEDLADAMKLAQRMQNEGIAPALSGREAQVDLARQALLRAQAAQTVEGAKVAGGTVEAAPVLQKAVAAIPERLPGGELPATGRPIRTAAERAADDVFRSVAATGGGTTRVPVETAISETARLDKLMRTFYEGGRTNIPQGVEFTKKAADAWRNAIRDQFPDLGAARIRTHELVTITNLLEDALRESIRQGGLGTSAAEAAAFGAGSVGRLSLPAILLAKAGVSAGPLASLSAGGKKLLSTLAAGGAETAQAWLRLAGIAADESEIERSTRNRRAQDAINAQGEGVVAP